MSKIDIRSMKTDDIREIQFDDIANDGYFAYLLTLERGVVHIYDDSDEHVLIKSKEAALNLKLALDKAIELGWFKE